MKNPNHIQLKRGKLKPIHQTQKLREWMLNEKQQKLVDASGLSPLALIAGFNVDHGLLTAFCERWRRETNTARLPGFEMAPSLRDVSYIIGLPVTGRAVVGEPIGRLGSEAVCRRYLGRIPGKGHFRCGLIKLTWLYNEFHLLPKNPSSDAIIYSTRAYLLYLIGCTIVTEPIKGLVSTRYLPLLGDLDKICEYAWGAAALAHLYRGLSVASEIEVCYLSGCATLLMAWIYEYLPVMRPKLKNQNSSSFPLACNWAHISFSPGRSQRNSVSAYRKKFDLLRESDVNWTPYMDMDTTTLPEYCRASDFISRARTWLISFNVKEIHVPDRYARQFGEVQHTPDDVPQWLRLGWNMSTDWKQVYAKEIEEFEQLTDACDIPPFRFKEKLAAQQCTKECSKLARHKTASESVSSSSGSSEDELRTMVKVLKKGLPVINGYLEGLSLPLEVMKALGRINELVQCSQGRKEQNIGSKVSYKTMQEGEKNGEVPGQGEPSNTFKSYGDLHSAQRSGEENSQGQGMQGCLSNPASHLVSSNKVQETVGKTVGDAMEPRVGMHTPTPSETPENSNSMSRKRERRRKSGSETKRLRRSGRICMQIKQFKHKGGVGEDPSNPISV